MKAAAPLQHEATKAAVSSIVDKVIINPLQLKREGEMMPYQMRQNPSASVSFKQNPLQLKENKTGLPDNLKANVEALSGFSLDDVSVHYNSDKPAKLNALAYAQGTDIYVAPGQEKQLPHEAWHVVQQKEGRVKSTIQMKGGLGINDDKELEKEADVMGGKAINSQKMLAIPVAASKINSTEAIRNRLRIQRKIENTALAEEVRTRYRKRFAEKVKLEKWISEPQYEVDNTKLYKEKLDKILKELAQVYYENVSFELKYISGSEKAAEDQVLRSEQVIDLELKDIAKEIGEFWKEVKKAYDIRSTLRAGSLKYKGNKSANIPELYAGSPSDALEIHNNKTYFAQLINDESWFTDTGGEKFVRHTYSRSAVLGYSPAGRTDIPLHIGHRNK